MPARAGGSSGPARCRHLRGSRGEPSAPPSSTRPLRPTSARPRDSGCLPVCVRCARSGPLNTRSLRLWPALSRTRGGLGHCPLVPASRAAFCSRRGSEGRESETQPHAQVSVLLVDLTLGGPRAGPRRGSCHQRLRVAILPHPT
jgi:hypothetical protein